MINSPKEKQSLGKTKSLRDLLLAHELIFITLIIVAVAGGSYGIYLWDKSSKESERINLVVQEIQQTRGDLYRQMKELFDATFLNDQDARSEYNDYTSSILQHFNQLKTLIEGEEENQAISDLEINYKVFANEAPEIFERYQASPNADSRKAIYQDMETGIFSRYESVSKRAEDLLTLKQDDLKKNLLKAKQISIVLLVIPILLAGILLTMSRVLLRRKIVDPINAIQQATSEISAGNLFHHVPETGATELAKLAQEINRMAEDLAKSRDALVRSEKQAAFGLLVPMLAHNIRNPLASIRATAQIIDIPSENNDTQESVNGIINTVDRLERWTGALLTYLHPVQVEFNSVSLSNILNGALLPLNQKIIDKKIQFSSEIASIQTNILTDQPLLEQVLYNLILNAIDASAQNAKVSFDASLKDGFLEMLISDQGIGMPFSPEAKSMTPGPSTKRFGTGLGIPFAFKACEVLNGTIVFNKQSPNGTQIKIRLPQNLSTLDD